MGAIHFSLDPALVGALQSVLPLRNFVETGTFRGDTAVAASRLFDRVQTIEFSEEIFAETSERLKSFPNLMAHFGNSPDILCNLKPELRDVSTLYWLDAHWCGGATSGSRYECPLIAELTAIGSLNLESVVLIDDARFFIAPPPEPHNVDDWPTLGELISKLNTLSNDHKLWVINDVIIFCPSSAEAEIINYGRKHGVDLNNLNMRARGAAQIIAERDIQISELRADLLHRAKPTPLSLGAGRPGRFNEALSSSDRSERIFSFHLEKMGISHLLDIGANSGQFASKIRTYGYQGVIYSVEPQREAHAALIVNASTDPKWFPLPRQGAGDSSGPVALNISENGWSSSLLHVHPNHIAAEPSTRIIGTEPIFVTKSSDLLSLSSLDQVEALKIDVQGFERSVLDGFGTSIKNIKLLLLEMSIQECYSGAPDLFSLDRHIVEELGFSRISLEPSYYDDNNGLAQQYDGIYYRPVSRAPRPGTGMQIAAIATSIGGSPRRTRPDGVDVGNYWQHECINSWKAFSTKIISVSESSPGHEGVEWVKTETRPSLSYILEKLVTSTSGSIILTNADIFLTNHLINVLRDLSDTALYYCHRHETSHSPENVEAFVISQPYLWGFDAFLIPEPLLIEIVDNKLLPDSFQIGMPWWDYALPLIAFALGVPAKRLSSETVFAGHYSHSDRFAPADWIKGGRHFLDLASSLKRRVGSHAMDLLSEITLSTEADDENLHRVSALMARQIP